MKDQRFEVRDDQAVSYLAQLEALASEIDIAIRAIATNALANLQASVAKQEILCNSLAMMASTAGISLPSSEPQLPLAGDVLIEDRINATIRKIRDLNLQYASLLKHSGRSIAILASLCRSHTGRFDDVVGANWKRQTWSCEV
jgi:hypothetical protein